ncbi:MAG TPA: condensation domain-containing protein, partial [Longimicrobium sp.]
LSSLSFDMSVYETLGILAAGGAVVVPTAAELRDPAAWAALMRDHAVTVWNSAPALLGMLVDHVESSPADAPAALRLAFLGGDWVPVTLPDRLRAHVPGMKIVVMGGATEASIHSIIFPVRETDPAWKSIPYGVPMANQRAYVLDAGLRPVPVGVPGELYLAGVGLARGYAGRPDLTAERFLPEVWGLEPGARMYRTGDLARYGEDGTIELLGRIDHQVKVRGFRIEPGEIETALRRHPRVERAVVVARADGGETRLVAYLVGAEGAAPPEARELRALLRETLPDYMVPAAYVTLDRLPLSANGKVDRGRLPVPPARAERAEYEAPRTPAECALAEIWAEVLGAARVGLGDDFFALGGHSLAAVRVAARVRERLGVQVALGEFFRVPTLAELARALDASARGATAAPIPRLPGDGPFPLAPAQRRLWLWEQMNPGAAAYNIPVALRLAGPLEAPALERALGEIVRRHEALRTAFAVEGGGPVQVILPEAPFTLPVETLPAGAGGEALHRRLAAEGVRPFDLAGGPPFRALLLRTGDEEHVLLLTFHHIVSDGWSIQLLLRELSALYNAFGRGEPSPLPPLPLRYADYAAWHQERLAAVEEGQLAWWRAHLAGAPALLELPTDRPRPAVQSHRGAHHPIRLSAELVERARALGRAEGGTLHTTLLAALYVVLGRHARAREVVIGSAPAGRTHPDTEALVGFFVNTLPIYADLSGDPGFRALLRQVGGSTLEAYDRQDVPFDRLVEALAPGASRSHAPLVQVAFAFQDAPARGFRLGAARAEPVSVDLGTAQFDLTFLLDEDEHGVAGVLEYATDLFDAATAERIAARLGVLLEAAVADPDCRLSRLPLLTEGERERMAAWSGAGEAFPVADALHARFEARAAARPEALAVTCEGETLTYGELNTRSNRLARRLRALGVAPESRVGLCAERSLDLVAGILAIVKAGAAYVPL